MDTLLDIKQLAAYLGLSVNATYRRHQRGQLPAPIRLGRSLRWRQSDIASMLAPGFLAMTQAMLTYTRDKLIADRASTTENEEMSK